MNYLLIKATLDRNYSADFFDNFMHKNGNTIRTISETTPAAIVTNLMFNETK